nr:hypothetical protein SHINE37_44133 [Rhizobiaceae bacterium]
MARARRLQKRTPRHPAPRPGRSLRRLLRRNPGRQNRPHIQRLTVSHVCEHLSRISPGFTLDPSIHATSEAYRGLDPRVKPEDDVRGDARDSFAG